LQLQKQGGPCVLLSGVTSSGDRSPVYLESSWPLFSDGVRVNILREAFFGWLVTIKDVQVGKVVGCTLEDFEIEMSSGETVRRNPPTNESSKKNHTHYLACFSILLEIGSMSAWRIEGVKFINSERREVNMKYAPQMVGIVILAVTILQNLSVESLADLSVDVDSQYPRAPHILSANPSDACSERSQRGQCVDMSRRSSRGPVGRPKTRIHTSRWVSRTL